MRRKPVTRSEVRFNGRIITTLPIHTVREDDLGYIAPKHKLREPLLRELNRASKRKYQERQQALANESIEDKALGANLRVLPRILGIERGPWKPTGLPDRYVELPRLLVRKQCGCKFYRIPGGSSPYRSDQCAEASWHDSRAIHNPAMVKARSAARAAARAGRRCAHCNEPITAQRSTSKFCSVRCRVAVHRERKAAAE